MSVIRPVMRYHGGKFRLAEWLISMFPPHRIYVEPFGGAASVLLLKPRSYAEVYNDLDGEVVNVFRVLRDPVMGAEFRRQVELTPYARDEFYLSYEPSDDPVEQARRTVFRSIGGFGSAAASGHRTGFRYNVHRRYTTPARDWLNYPDVIAQFTERLAGVVIENRPATAVMTAHDSPETLHYVDPPYPHGTRSSMGHHDRMYRHEMTDDEHRTLAAVLRGLDGMVVLSGYPCDLYDRDLFPDWSRVERTAFADGARERTEVCWLNAAAAAGQPQMGIFG